MRMLLVAASCLAVLTILPSLNHAAQSEPSKEEYQVYSAVIRGLPIDLPNNLLMINEYTDIGDRPRLLDQQQSPQELLQELYAKNLHGTKLTTQFSIPYRYHLLNRDEDVGYGYSLLSLSRVAFNRSMDQALIYARFTKGGVSSKEWYVLLIKSGGQWRVQRTLAVIKSP